MMNEIIMRPTHTHLLLLHTPSFSSSMFKRLVGSGGGTPSSGGGKHTSSPASSNAMAEAKSRMLDDILAQDAWESRNKVKMLILGAGGCGKTTLRKQLARLYGGAFATIESRKELRQVVLDNLFEGTNLLLAQLERQSLSTDLSRSVKEKLSELTHRGGVESIDDETAGMLKALREDPNFANLLSTRHLYQIQECVVSFYSSLVTNYPEWGGKSWIPSVEDCVSW